jgi:hypothetical protein
MGGMESDPRLEIESPARQHAGNRRKVKQPAKSPQTNFENELQQIERGGVKSSCTFLRARTAPFETTPGWT